uniref:DDE Tnp4 domain-containing protein n=1 Tax=Acanthochromis polyacanthus TaxID=80966 RepID=A0A3Q1FGQ9_9TELE
MLPIYLSKKRVKEIEKEFSTFIWKAKRSRLKMVLLHLPKDSGGLALPDIRMYNWACRGRTIREWIQAYLNEENDPIESGACAPYKLLGEITSKKISPEVHHNPILFNIVRSWQDMSLHVGQKDCFSLLFPLNNRQFLPGVSSAKMNRTAINEMSLQNNHSKVNILTGLSTYSLLIAVFNVIAPYLKHKSSLTLFQQYMLALIKIRMNLSFDFLSYYFCIDPTAVSKLFKHSISVMYCRLVPSFVIWPDRESLRKSLPYAFKNSLNLLASAQCYSTYKSNHTMKYLIAITPQGSICFISNGWGGRTSDKVITEQSSFLSHLLPGDLVLADRGFNVKDLVQAYQAELKLPAFTRGKKQIHIERVIGVLCQKYTILQSTASIGFTDIDTENDVTYLDKIVKVCCALTNVSESVVPFQ